MKKTVVNVNIAEFLAEFFMNRTGEKVQFSYGLFWDAIHEDLRKEYCLDVTEVYTDWFHTGFVNNFTGKDPETNLLHFT